MEAPVLIPPVDRALQWVRRESARYPDGWVPWDTSEGAWCWSDYRVLERAGLVERAPTWMDVLVRPLA